MNYIIWNGINSDAIKGLIIQELPPITKPQVRTQITEIEGKDGDISDDLGYQSYDKTIKIGLCGNYDINKIAKYFTGSGKIIFSNEPDKYYNSAIYEQIDFERLTIFREATAKFHCQPFKYLVSKPVIDMEITDQTQVLVINQGLEVSKPIITLTSSGTLEISVNGFAQFQYDFESDDHVTIDSMLQDAYLDTTENLKNRQMIGEFPTLKPGINTITWTGTLTEIKVQPNSRWL
jgi:predicted phage tail component-like protein